MRVAAFVSAFPLISETFVTGQLVALIEAGIDLQILAERRGDFTAIDPRLAQTTRPHCSYASENLTYRIASVLKRPYRLVASLRRSAIIASDTSKGKDYDILYAHFGWNAIRAVNLKKNGLLNGRIWAVFHGRDLSATIASLGGQVYSELFQHADRCLPVSEYWRNRLLELGCPADKIYVHRLGVDCKGLAFVGARPSAGDPLQIVSVCRLVPKKGLSVTLRALAGVRSIRPNLRWRYEIVGGGPLEESLREEIERLKLNDCVRLVGEKPPAKALDFIRAADLFVLSSLTAPDGDMEGIPVVLMEAMAIGTPVVSSRHSGIPELVIDGRTGLLAKEGCVESLASTIVALLENPSLRQSLAREARAMVLNDYSAARQNAALVDLIRASVC